MKPTFFIKNTIIFLLLLSSNNLIISMEEVEVPEKEIEEEKPLIKTPEYLMELAAEQAGKKAAQIYDEQGYDAFEKYLESLPAYVKTNLVFCSLITKLDRTDIFIGKLKQIYQESKENAFKYFSEFCHEGQLAILKELLDQDELDENFIQDLINSITNREIIKDAYSLISDIVEYESEREVNREFYLHLLATLKYKTKFLSKPAAKQIGKVSLSDENLKQAKEIYDIALQRRVDSSDETVETFQNVFSRFKRLDKQDQIEILQYIFTESGTLSNWDADNAFYILFRYITGLEHYWDLNTMFGVENISRLDEEQLEEAINVFFEIVNKFDQVYPEVKKIADLPGPKDVSHVSIFNFLNDNLSFLVNELASKLIRNNKLQEALELLTNMSQKSLKFKIAERSSPGEYSILANYHALLDFVPEELSKEDVLNYFKNLYSLLEKSIPVIKRQFRELVQSEIPQEQEEIKEAWSEALSTWYDSYIASLRERNLVTEEETKGLTEKFKKEIIGKFQS